METAPKERKHKAAKHRHHDDNDDDATRVSVRTSKSHRTSDSDYDKKRDERRRKKAARQLAESYAALGLDENGEPLDNFSLSKYPVRECKFTVPGGGSQDVVAINPVVMFICIVTLWAVVLWSIVDPGGASPLLDTGRMYISLKFTWFYQAVKAVMFFFVLYVTYTYGHLQLGRTTDTPEFGTVTYFCLVFAASVGSALLASGVSDPLYQREGNFFANAGYRSQDEKDMFAINMQVTTWSVGSFIGITLVAVCMSLAGYRFNLPMTFRSCFYPILGPYTWGWMGDCIDSLSIVVMVASMCIMLGTTAMSVVAGLEQLGLIDKNLASDDVLFMQNITIWIITIASTVSVITGLRGGIQFMALAAVALASLLTFLVFILDDSKFLLNLIVQEVGYFAQYSVFQLNFWTDAFGQLREGSGRAVDGKAADQDWMNSWMMFYYAWTFGYTSVLGMFVAYVSKGRAIRDVVLCSFVGPVLVCLVSSCMWGGVCLRQLRQSLELSALGERYFNNSAHFAADGSEYCYNVPQDEVVLDGETVFTNHVPFVSPVCLFDADNPSSAMFNVLDSFHLSKSLRGDGLGPFLSILFVLACTVFYTSHADSATFIVDTMASNGRKNYHWSRRMFWSCTVAALATALLSTSANAIDAVTAATIVGSLPITILLCFLLQSVTLFCRAADKLQDTTDSTEYEFPDQPEFGMPLYGGIFNIVEYAASLGRHNAARVELGMHQPTQFHVIEFVKGIVVPFVSLNQVLSATYPHNPRTNAAVVACHGAAYIGWGGLVFASMAHPGLSGVATTAFLAAGCIIGMVRSGFRSHYTIRSNSFADFVGGIFLWPQVLSQMRMDYSVPHAATVNKHETLSKASNKAIVEKDDEYDA